MLGRPPLCLHPRVVGGAGTRCGGLPWERRGLGSGALRLTLRAIPVWTWPRWPVSFTHPRARAQGTGRGRPRAGHLCGTDFGDLLTGGGGSPVVGRSNGPRGREPGGTAVRMPCLGRRPPWRRPGLPAHTAACGSGRRAGGLAVSRNIRCGGVRSGKPRGIRGPSPEQAPGP